MDDEKLPLEFNEGQRFAIVNELVKNQDRLGETLESLKVLDEATGRAMAYEIDLVKAAMVGCARLVEEVLSAKAKVL